MPYSAPWLQPTDVLAAQTRGSEIGLQRRKLAQDAADDLRRHSENMARIAASNAQDENRMKLYREELKQKGQQASEALRYEREQLGEKARQADVKAALEQQKLGAEDVFGYANLGKSGVLKINKRTGKEEWLTPPGGLDPVQEALNKAMAGEGDFVGSGIEEAPTLSNTKIGPLTSMVMQNPGTGRVAPPPQVVSSLSRPQGAVIASGNQNAPSNQMYMGPQTGTNELARPNRGPKEKGQSKSSPIKRYVIDPKTGGLVLQKNEE